MPLTPREQWAALALVFLGLAVGLVLAVAP